MAETLERSDGVGLSSGPSSQAPAGPSRYGSTKTLRWRQRRPGSSAAATATWLVCGGNGDLARLHRPANFPELITLNHPALQSFLVYSNWMGGGVGHARNNGRQFRHSSAQFHALLSQSLWPIFSRSSCSFLCIRRCELSFSAPCIRLFMV